MSHLSENWQVWFEFHAGEKMSTKHSTFKFWSFYGSEFIDSLAGEVGFA
jgi:hypothetical protein